MFDRLVAKLSRNPERTAFGPFSAPVGRVACPFRGTVDIEQCYGCARCEDGLTTVPDSCGDDTAKRLLRILI